MIKIRKIINTMLALVLANGIVAQVLADDYYTYGSTAFSGFAAESYGAYVFAVGSSGAGDNQVHAWSVGIPQGADTNDRNYQGTGSAAPRTFTYLGSFNLGYNDNSNQASLYVSNDTLWYGSGQHVALTEGRGITTTGLRAYSWDVVAGSLVGDRDNNEDVIFDENVIDGNDETIPDSGTLAYDEQTDTWYTGTSDRKIFHLDDNNNWIEDFTHLDMGGDQQGGIEFVNGSLVISDMSSGHLAFYENLGSVTTPDWQIIDKDGDGVREGVAGIHDLNFDDLYNYTNSENVAGLGFGQFEHLWVTSGTQLYELGGGQLQDSLAVVPSGLLQQQRIAVHEPSSVLLFMSSLLSLAYIRRRELME